MNVHGAVAPLWFTENVCPAMVNVPARPVELALAATEKLTLLGPVTEAGDVSVIHVSFARAVHARRANDVTYARARERNVPVVSEM